MSPNSTSRKFTFDTEFHGAENRQSSGAKARQKQTLTVEELDALKALPPGDVEIALRQAMHQAIGEPRIT